VALSAPMHVATNSQHDAEQGPSQHPIPTNFNLSLNDENGSPSLTSPYADADTGHTSLGAPVRRLRNVVIIP